MDFLVIVFVFLNFQKKISIFFFSVSILLWKNIYKAQKGGKTGGSRPMFLFLTMFEKSIIILTHTNIEFEKAIEIYFSNLTKK